MNGERFQSSEFESTHWSLVFAAGDLTSPQSKTAIANLCQRYWYPLYAYVRRRCADREEAQDLTQEFFARLLEKNLVASADPQRGRFRTFLLTSLRNFLADQWDKSKAHKRGGDATILPLDFAEAESRYTMEPAHSETAERLFEREWTSILLENVITQLRDEYVRAGKGRQFDKLNRFIGRGTSETSYAQVAHELSISEGAARVAAHRLRRRFADLFRSEILQTVAGPDDVEDEIRTLLANLRKKRRNERLSFP